MKLDQGARKGGERTLLANHLEKIYELVFGLAVIAFVVRFLPSHTSDRGPGRSASFKVLASFCGLGEGW